MSVEEKASVTGMSCLAAPLLRQIASFLPWLDSLAFSWTRKHYPRPPAVREQIFNSLVSSLGAARAEILMRKMRAGRAGLFGSCVLQTLLGVRWPGSDIDILVLKRPEDLQKQGFGYLRQGHGPNYEDFASEMHVATIREFKKTSEGASELVFDTKIDFVAIQGRSLLEHMTEHADISFTRVLFTRDRLLIQRPDDLFARHGRLVTAMQTLKLRANSASGRPHGVPGTCLVWTLQRALLRTLRRLSKYINRGFRIDCNGFGRQVDDSLQSATELCGCHRCNTVWVLRDSTTTEIDELWDQVVDDNEADCEQLAGECEEKEPEHGLEAQDDEEDVKSHSAVASMVAQHGRQLAREQTRCASLPVHGMLQRDRPERKARNGATKSGKLKKH